MATLSTHVLDIALGRPAQGIPVTLEREGVPLGHAVTDQDGRGRELVTGSAQLAPGTYRLVFAVEGYFTRRQIDSLYSLIPVQFTIREEGHYHIPLLLSPYGYSTYRGS